MAWIAPAISIASAVLGAGKKAGQGQGGSIATGSPAQLNTAYNQAQTSIAQQQDFVKALQAQNGLSNQSNVFNQQQGLANQLQGVIAGTGPNPAQAQLAQATGANVSNQAALMAGQRGAAANTGLMARQAAQQGANIQQQSAGQAATMQAQQSLAAMEALRQQQGMMGNLAGNQVSQTQTGLQNLGQQSQGEQANLLGLTQSANAANSAMNQQNAQASGNMFGNITGALGSAAQLFGGGSKGGTPKTQASTYGDNIQAAEGGQINSGQLTGPQSFVGKHLNGIQMAHGGKVPAMVSPGERYLPPKEVEKVAKGEKKPMHAGEKIPGKPKVGGARDSYRNDSVPKQLEEGGIVIPRSVTQGKNPEKAAHDFISAILAKNKPLSKKK